MARINEIDRRVLRALSGRDKLKALLADKGMSLKDFAERHNEWVENVSRCLAGERPLPELREKLAEDLGMSREAVDMLIDGGVVEPSRKVVE